MEGPFSRIDRATRWRVGWSPPGSVVGLRIPQHQCDVNASGPSSKVHPYLRPRRPRPGPAGSSRRTSARPAGLDPDRADQMALAHRPRRALCRPQVPSAAGRLGVGRTARSSCPTRPCQMRDRRGDRPPAKAGGAQVREVVVAPVRDALRDPRPDATPSRSARPRRAGGARPVDVRDADPADDSATGPAGAGRTCSRGWLEDRRPGLRCRRARRCTPRRSHAPIPSRSPVERPARGAIADATVAARLRAGSIAAQASARRPPPRPARASRSRRSPAWSMGRGRRRAASSATVAVVARIGSLRVEPPYPGASGTAMHPQATLAAGRSEDPGTATTPCGVPCGDEREPASGRRSGLDPSISAVGGWLRTDHPAQWPRVPQPRQPENGSTRGRKRSPGRSATRPSCRGTGRWRRTTAHRRRARRRSSTEQATAATVQARRPPTSRQVVATR